MVNVRQNADEKPA